MQAAAQCGKHYEQFQAFGALTTIVLHKGIIAMVPSFRITTGQHANSNHDRGVSASAIATAIRFLT